VSTLQQTQQVLQMKQPGMDAACITGGLLRLQHDVLIGWHAHFTRNEAMRMSNG
jgi:hypothetical protein